MFKVVTTGKAVKKAVWGLGFVAILSCGQGPGAGTGSEPDSSDLSRIIGSNDLVRIGKGQQSSRIVKAIGRMELGCTATHVGNGIAISAGHCFAGQPFAGKRTHRSCAGSSYEVTWGLTYGAAGQLTSQCEEVLATEFNDQRDYAIFRVYPQPDEALPVASSKPTPGQKISILSHPRKRPLEWSGYCSIEGFYPKSGRNQFRYGCDTEGGSSGAAVLNDRMQVVGIHNYYNGEYNRNGGTFVAATPLTTIISEAL